MEQTSNNVTNRHIWLVIGGYLIILALLGFTTKTGLDNLNALNESLRTVVQQNNVKSQHMYDMRDGIRERILLLHTAIQLQDAFEIDEVVQKYNAMARQFIIARDELTAMELTEDQRQQLMQQRTILGEAQIILDEVINAIANDQHQGIGDKMLMAQEKNQRVVDQLQQMRLLQQKIAEQAVASSAKAMSAARAQIFTLIGITVVLASIILFIVVTVISRQGKAVSSLLRRLEESNAGLEVEVSKRTNELFRSREDNVRMGAELAVASQLQQMLLPRDAELDMIPELQIAATMSPAEEAGGDYYDVLRYDGRTIIGIGDVTGHGLESSVVMLMTQAAVRTLAASGIVDPVRFLTILNRTIYDNLRRLDSYKNLTLMLTHYSDDTLTICGQHEDMLLVRKGANTVERIDTIDLGFPIGLEQDIEEFLKPHQVILQSGDTVVLYTDGIPEAEDSAGNFYGVERLCEQVLSHIDAPVQEVHDRIIEDLHRHINEHTIYDDITLMVIRKI
jgi:serine phosphatase RsbU (regulator of sigma subunit)